MLNKTIISIGNDTNVLCEILNARQLRLVFSIPPQVIDIESDIFEIRVGENGLSILDKLTVPIDSKIQSVYEINKIERLNNTTYLVNTSLATKTKQFILPCLNEGTTNKEYFLYDTLLENVYLGASKLSLEDSENTLLLLYRYSESELYRQFESRIIKHPMFIKKIDINYYQVMFLFNISKYTEDIRKFKYGSINCFVLVAKLVFTK